MTRVAELMTKDVIHSVHPDSTVEGAAERMTEVHRGCLVVIDGGKLVGIVTERDLVQRVMAKGYMPDRVRVSEIMSKPVITVGPEALLTDAARIMMENRIRRLPVIEGFDVVGDVWVSMWMRVHPNFGHSRMRANRGSGNEGNST
jgi:CBS domain-containing protein